MEAQTKMLLWKFYFGTELMPVELVCDLEID
jgi:hypothetical protein